MKLYKYTNYEDYVAAQEEANKRKITNVWVREKTIEQIQKRVPKASNILCHGTRNAAEQKYFKKRYPNANIIGTEISETASQFPMTVQHDFHETKEEWVGAFDIVYANSWDHSYDPKRSLLVWINQLKDDGLLFLEQATDSSDNRARRSDPLEINHDEIVELIKELGAKLVEFYDDKTGPGARCPITMYVIST